MTFRCLASIDLLQRLSCGVLAAPLLLVGTIGCGAVALEEERRAELQAEFEPWRADFLKDQREFADHWLFQRRPGGVDASVVLAFVAGWKGTSGGDIAGTSGVPATLRANIEAWGSNWVDHVDDVDLAGVDLGWMKDLARFDFWDLEADGSPMNEVPWNWRTTPIPDFISLQTAAKVRLLQGLREAKGAEAAAEVRELARLTASTETLVGEMIGVAMIKSDVRARQMATKREQDVTSWPISTMQEAERLRRTMWAANGLFSTVPLAPAIENDVVVGRCAALLEGGASALMVRGLMNERYLERYASLTKSINDSSCRLKNLRRAWNQAPSHEQTMRNFWVFDGSRFEVLKPLLLLPPVAEHVGAFAASATPSPAKYYIEASTKGNDGR
jgi:hypothetical protein